MSQPAFLNRRWQLTFWSGIMFGNTLKQHFMVMGADVDVTVDGDRFEVDVQNTGRSEVFKIRLPDDGPVTARVQFVDVFSFDLQQIKGGQDEARAA
jgi:hypothetical protein